MVKDGTTLRREAGGCAPTVDVLDADRKLTPTALAWLTHHAGRAARAMEARGEARVKIVGDAAMARAHERFSGVPGTTDVLTFDLNDEPPAIPSATRLLDADILVCADEAQRQAGTRGHAPERELLLYIVHALLHCTGFDDRDEPAAAAMHAREDEVLEAIGVGATYATRAIPGPGGGP